MQCQVDSEYSPVLSAVRVPARSDADVSKVNIYFVGVLFVVLMMCTHVPAIPMFLVEYYYR